MQASNQFVSIIINDTKVKKQKFLLNEDNDNTKEHLMSEGEITSIGEEAKNFKKGDRVIFDTYKSVKYQNYWITDYKNILGKI